MITRKKLLNNIRDYSPEDIASAVRNGVVSMYDLTKETGGAFTPLLKRRVKAILDNPIGSSSGIKDSIDSKIVHSDEIFTSFESVSNIPEIEPVIPQEESILPIAVVASPVVECDSSGMIGKGAMAEPIVISKETPAMFSRIFSFKGRIRRLEFGLSYLIYCVWNMFMVTLEYTELYEVYVLFYLVTFIPMCWVIFAQGAKRCHDLGNSGWYQLIPFYYLWMIFAEGEKGVNKYGQSPK